MKVSAIRSCMVGVSDLERSLQLFQGVMQLRLERRGELSADELRLYDLPATTRAQYADLTCAGHPTGCLRLVQYSPTPTRYVRIDHDGADSPTDIGPKALDFYVADPISYRATSRRAGSSTRTCSAWR
jgi:catechol 2,3-dioxygenase-like lactoylglutathione lyase family enzyme